MALNNITSTQQNQTQLPSLSQDELNRKGEALLQMLKYIKQLQADIERKKQEIAPYIQNKPLVLPDGTVSFSKPTERLSLNRKTLKQVLIAHLKISDDVAERLLNAGSMQKLINGYVKIISKQDRQNQVKNLKPKQLSDIHALVSDIQSKFKALNIKAFADDTQQVKDEKGLNTLIESARSKQLQMLNTKYPSVYKELIKNDGNLRTKINAYESASKALGDARKKYYGEEVKYPDTVITDAEKEQFDKNRNNPNTKVVYPDAVKTNDDKEKYNQQLTSWVKYHGSSYPDYITDKVNEELAKNNDNISTPTGLQKLVAARTKYREDNPDWAKEHPETRDDQLDKYNNEIHGNNESQNIAKRSMYKLYSTSTLANMMKEKADELDKAFDKTIAPALKQAESALSQIPTDYWKYAKDKDVINKVPDSEYIKANISNPIWQKAVQGYTGDVLAKNNKDATDLLLRFNADRDIFSPERQQEVDGLIQRQGELFKKLNDPASYLNNADQRAKDVSDLRDVNSELSKFGQEAQGKYQTVKAERMIKNQQTQRELPLTKFKEGLEPVTTKSEDGTSVTDDKATALKRVSTMLGLKESNLSPIIKDAYPNADAEIKKALDEAVNSKALTPTQRDRIVTAISDDKSGKQINISAINNMINNMSSGNQKLADYIAQNPDSAIAKVKDAKTFDTIADAASKIQDVGGLNTLLSEDTGKDNAKYPLSKESRLAFVVAYNKAKSIEDKIYSIDNQLVSSANTMSPQNLQKLKLNRDELVKQKDAVYNDIPEYASYNKAKQQYDSLQNTIATSNNIAVIEKAKADAKAMEPNLVNMQQALSLVQKNLDTPALANITKDYESSQAKAADKQRQIANTQAVLQKEWDKTHPSELEDTKRILVNAWERAKANPEKLTENQKQQVAKLGGIDNVINKIQNAPSVEVATSIVPGSMSEVATKLAMQQPPRDNSNITEVSKLTPAQEDYFKRLQEAQANQDAQYEADVARYKLIEKARRDAGLPVSNNTPQQQQQQQQPIQENQQVMQQPIPANSDIETLARVLGKTPEEVLKNYNEENSNKQQAIANKPVNISQKKSDEEDEDNVNKTSTLAANDTSNNNKDNDNIQQLISLLTHAQTLGFSLAQIKAIKDAIEQKSSQSFKPVQPEPLIKEDNINDGLYGGVQKPEEIRKSQQSNPRKQTTDNEYTPREPMLEANDYNAMEERRVARAQIAMLTQSMDDINKTISSLDDTAPADYRESLQNQIKSFNESISLLENKLK